MKAVMSSHHSILETLSVLTLSSLSALSQPKPQSGQIVYHNIPKSAYRQEP